MVYDFETPVSRRTCGSSKWNLMLEKCPDVPKGIAPLSVADMELKNPPEIVEGLKTYLDNYVLGYTSPTKDYLQTVCGWLQTRHNWTVQPEEIVLVSNVVMTLYAAVLAYTSPGDGVITMPPVYGPFSGAVLDSGRVNAECPLLFTNNAWEIDFDRFETLCRKPENKMFLLCSPHNPVGRVWTREELARIGKICAENHVFVVSDEIHFDLIMPGHIHTVFPNACEDACPEYLICTAPSKSFNLATLQISNIIIPDAARRAQFDAVIDSVHAPACGALGMEACRLGYTLCADWLQEVIELIWGNYRICCDFLDAACPGVTYSDLQGTYLMWLDCSAFGLSDDALMPLLEKHYFFCGDGLDFSQGGAQHIRINLAGPRRMLESAMLRFRDAYREAKNI